MRTHYPERYCTIDTAEKFRLRRYTSDLRTIVNRKTAVTQRRRILQQKGGFLPALLAPLAATVFLPLLRQLFV